MKKLIAGALLVVLSGITSIARAEFAPEPRPVVAGAPARPVAASTTPATSETSQYAAREAANPAQGEFQGGATAVYIGGGAVTVLLVVLLIVLLV